MKVAIIEPLQLERETIIDKFQSLGCEVDYYDSKPETKDEIYERAKNAEIVVIVNTPLGGDIIGRLEKLKMVAVSFTGYDHIDIDRCREKGIVVSNVPEYSTDSVAELVFGFLISFFRKLNECDRALRAGKGNQGLMGRELRGKTIGVVGTGRIGSRVCEIALCFGMNVLAYSRTEKEELVRKGVRYVTLHDLLRSSDVISIHLPLNKETENLLGENELSMLKDGCVVVNTGRGKIIDTTALARELEKGRIFACLDVFDMEPPLPGDHPLRNPKNTLLAPHVGYYTEEALKRRLDITVENIRAFIKGNPINVVS
jgi:D-3-phosphoglycerate dehydrogenase